MRRDVRNFSSCDECFDEDSYILSRFMMAVKHFCRNSQGCCKIEEGASSDATGHSHLRMLPPQSGWMRFCQGTMRPPCTNHRRDGPQFQRK